MQWSLRLVSTSPSRFFRFMGWMRTARIVVRRQLKRRFVLPFFKNLSPCLVGIQACATSHYWSRELQALRHCVRLTIVTG